MNGVTATDVFDALRDGQTYGHWVVGTRTIRQVEPGWPAPGTALHYTAGYAPLRKDDKTVSKSYAPDRRLELEARAWPAGAAGIVLTVQDDGSGVVVTIEETPTKGVAKLIHNPLLDLAIKARNVETLRRLEQDVRARV